MSIVFFSGFETGDVSEWTGSFGTVTLDSTTNVGGVGGYSLSFPWNNSNHYVYTNFSPTLSTAYGRFGLYTTAGGGASVSWLAGFNASGVVIGAIRLVTDGGGNVYLRLYNNVTSAQVGSDFQFSTGQRYLVELKLIVSATVGVLEMRVGGIVVATGSNLNTGTSNTDALQLTQQSLSGTGATGNVWFDDVLVRTDQYPGNGFCIARQGNTTAPNYNSWTKNGGTNIWQVWDQTPYTTGTSASIAAASSEQSMVVDFTTIGGTGSTGHGIGTVGSWDVINALKISAIGLTSSTTTDGADSTVFRTPAGGGGSDTNTAFGSAWTASASYRETLLSSTPTVSQVRGCEIGLIKGSGTNTHTAYAVWAQIDYQPIPYSIFQGSESEPSTPMSYEMMVDDSGEEQSWYPPTSEDQAQLIWALPVSTIIGDSSVRTFMDYTEGDYYSPATDDVAFITITLPQPLLILESGMRTFSDYSDADYYPPIDVDPSAWAFIITTPPNLELIASQWDNQAVEFVELYIEDSEGDFYPDFSIDNTAFFHQVTAVEVLLSSIQWDAIPTDPDQLIEDDGEDQAWYGQLFDDLTQWFYPTTVVSQIDGWQTVYANATSLIINFKTAPVGIVASVSWATNVYYSISGNVVTFSFGTAAPNTGGTLVWMITPTTAAVSGSSSSVNVTSYTPGILALANWNTNVYYSISGSTVTLNFSNAAPGGGGTVSWINSTPETYSIALGINSIVYPTPVEPIAGYIVVPTWNSNIYFNTATTTFNFSVTSPGTTQGLAFYPVALNTSIVDPVIFNIINFYAPDTLEQLTEDSEGDLYPDFSIDNSWLSTLPLPSGLIPSLISYTPLEIDQLLDDLSEGDYYPDFSVDMTWFFAGLPVLLVFIDYSPLETEILMEDTEGDYYPDFSIDISWYFLGAIPPLIFSDYAPLESEQLIEDTGEGDYYPDTSIDLTWYFNQVLPIVTVLFVMANQSDDSGNSVPLAFDSFIEDDGSEPTWYPIEGNVNAFLIPIGQLILIIASQWDNQVADLFEFYVEDSEGDYYPPQDELLSWFIPHSQSFILIFNDYAPLELETLTEDTSEEPAWYAPQEEQLSWFIISPPIPAVLVFNEYIFDVDANDVDPYIGYDVFYDLILYPANTLLIFNDYTPLEVDQLTEDSGEDQAWYPAKEEELQWFIPLQPQINMFFNDYTPLETETLTEESQGDYYPSFDVDPSPWFFVVGPGIIIMIVSNSTVELADDYILDSGDEPIWYSVTGDIQPQFIPIGIEVLVGSNQEYSKAADFLEIYSEESEGDYYSPQDDTFSWFFVQPLIVPNFIFIDYNPRELDQLIEESEGDFYPDFSIDPASFFHLVPPNPFLYSAVIQWDAEPRDAEQLTEDSGEDISWFYPLDIVIVLIGSIKYQFNMPLTTTIQLYFNLVQFTSSATQIIYGN